MSAFFIMKKIIIILMLVLGGVVSAQKITYLHSSAYCVSTERFVWKNPIVNDMLIIVNPFDKTLQFGEHTYIISDLSPIQTSDGIKYFNILTTDYELFSFIEINNQMFILIKYGNKYYTYNAFMYEKSWRIN